MFADDDNLEPGGWVELQEVDLYPTSDDETLKSDSNLLEWYDLFQGASNKFGRSFFRIAPLKNAVIDVGFVDAFLTVTKWPSNAWPKHRKWKEIVIRNGESMMSGLEGFSMAAVSRGHGWTREEVNVFLVDMRKEIKDRGVNTSWPVYFITGRRPEKDPT
ncbi:methyltransferase domain-containing protein [Colletotrichum tabaci]|uniref:Methyltransferase domain-containing protein n=1 Tax=Colletotrichum tabaci TaxID=1209068 RepID=A0AAV9TUG5_9PEZI